MAADLRVDQKASRLETSDKLQGYSRVVVKTGQTDDNGNDVVYIAGTDTGRTLEIENPWIQTQADAERILSKIQGWAYQPITASGVSLNPAFEIGDSVVVDDIFSGVYSADVRFSHLFAADIQAPCDKEINHEYTYEDSRERAYVRKLNDVVAKLNFYSGSIEAKVDKQTGTSGVSSFGWNLTDSSWTVFNQNGDLFKVTSIGAYVKGEIQASSGKIGGFTIGSKGIYNNISSYGGSGSTGVYVGTDGIQLGQNFKVGTNGTVKAANMELTGTLKIGGTSITAANLRQGAERANSGYSSWNSAASSVSANGSLWTTGARAGNDANYTWTLAQNTSQGVGTLVTNALYVKQARFFYQGYHMQLVWLSSLGAYVLASYGEG